MTSIRFTCLFLVGCLLLVASTGCDPVTGGLGTGFPLPGNENVNDNGKGDPPSGDDGTVGDVVTGDDTSPLPGQPLPVGVTIAARVRNESDFRADVTLRFIAGRTVVHLAFVRVLAGTVTTITSPASADLIELNGVDERGVALPLTSFVFGTDFSENSPAEFVIERVDDPDTPPPTSTALTIAAHEPTEDVVLTQGSALMVRWADEAALPGAVVRVLLQRQGTSEFIAMGSAIGAALDGLNDELSVVIEGIDPGRYEVVVEIDDGIRIERDTAPGVVEIVTATGNQAPFLAIVAPTAYAELRRSDRLSIEWDDADPDDNATISFSLEPSVPSGVPVAPFPVGPPIAEDPDGPGQDRALLAIDDVLPGLYDLVGRIDDGELVGTARASGVVRVLAEPANVSPQIVLLEPARNLSVLLGGSFRVRWDDSDANDNARISLLLDPDLDSGALDGDEIVMVAALGEDQDGPADVITLGVPDTVPAGEYRVAASITDGVADFVTWANGLIAYNIVDNGTETPTIALPEPSVAVHTRQGLSFNALVETDSLPPGTIVRLFLSNVSYGGELRVEVTPTPLTENETIAVAVPASAGQIPNEAWPRRFTLEAEMTIGGVTQIAVAPASVLIRQEVEILDVAMVNYRCTDASDPVLDNRRYFGVEVTWYGGGFEEREPHDDVHFWLTGDGTVALDQQEDTLHAVHGVVPESPNVHVVSQFNVPAVQGFPDRIGRRSRLEAGNYQVLPIAQTSLFGPIASPAHPQLIEGCFPVMLP